MYIYLSIYLSIYIYIYIHVYIYMHSICIMYKNLGYGVFFRFEFSLENLIFLCEASRGNEGGLNFPNQ